MQLTCLRRELKDACAGLAKIIPNKASLPILGAIRFDLTGTTITAQGTDLDQAALFQFAHATAEGTGSMILPFVTVKELTKGRDDEPITFEQDGLSGVITNPVGGHAIRIPVVAFEAGDWPATDFSLKTRPAQGFLDTYQRLTPFASEDPSRYVIQGVFADLAGKGDKPCTLVATDGRRLTACNSLNLPLKEAVILPVARFLCWTGLPTGDEELGAGKAQFCVRSGAWTYVGRLIEGSFPNWRQVVPDPASLTERINLTETDAKSLARILTALPGEDLVILRGRGGFVTVAGRGKDDRQDTVVELTGGSRFEGTQEIGLSRRFLLDALDAGFLNFAFSATDNPLRSDDGKGGTHVLMPIRLNHEPHQPAQDITPVPAPTPAAAPVAEPVASINPPAPERPASKEKQAMTTETQTETSALDRLMGAYETAKQKVKEANQALSDVATAIREAARENRQLKADVESVRAGLAKLQAIKV